MSFPHDRPRRLRATPAMRRLVAETRLAPADLVLPLFVKEGDKIRVDTRNGNYVERVKE